MFLSANFIYAARLDDLIQQAQNRAEQAQQKIEQIREDVQERLAAKREAIEQKISQIKDRTKRSSAERIADQLNHINVVWTDHFSNVLDKLDAVLQKIKSRRDKALANGEDVSSVNTAIANAESKIAAARSAVENQAGKAYEIDAAALSSANMTQSSQDNLVKQLREQFKELRDQLFTDLTSLRDGAMRDARSSIQDAMQELSNIPNVDEEPGAD